MKKGHIVAAALAALAIILTAGGATAAPLSITHQYADYITPTIGTPYSITIRTVGGQGPFIWSVSTGSLPPGITLNPTTGVLSGTATAPGSYDFTIVVTDALAATDTYQMTAYVDPLSTLAQTFLYSTQLTGASEHGNGVALQPNGNLNIAGGTESSNPRPNGDYLDQLTTTGTVVWTATIPQASTAKDTIGVATDYAGNAYALTEYVPASGVGLTHVAWIKPTIGSPWTQPFGDAAQNGFITANDYGDIFVTLLTEYTNNTAKTETMKIDPITGTVLWKDTYTGDIDCPLFKSYANKTDDEGNIYIAGSCTLNDPDKTTFGAIRKLDINGAFIWQNPYIPTGICSGGNCPTGSILNTTSNLCEAPAVHYPSCPTGLTYNSSLTICQGNPLYNCPAGTSYDGSLCYSPPTITHTCQTGFTYNSTSDRCEAPATAVCPTGSTYNATSTYCEAAPGPGQDCQAGFTYDSASQKCVTTPNCITGSTLNTTRGTCQEAPIVDMLCPPQTTWNSTTSKCEALSICPSTVAFNPATNLCEAQPICPGSSVYNLVTNQCEIASTGVTQCTAGTYNSVSNKCEGTPLSGPTCSPTTTYNASAYKCEGPPTCTPGGSYNTADDLCEATPGCPASTVFNNDTNLCEATGTANYNCSSGTYNAATGKCEAVYTMTCPTGTAWNTTALKCQATPTCNTGGSYDMATHICDATPTCPSGTSFSSATNQCEGIGTPNYNCSAGTYNGATGKCEATSTTTCPDGFTLNGTKCESSPICGAPGTFNAATNVCQANITCPSSSSYYFTTKICESAQQANSCDYYPTYTFDSTYKACTAQPSDVTCPGTGPSNHYNNDGVNCASTADNFICPSPGYYEPNLSRCASTTNTSPYTMNQCWVDSLTQTTICRYVGGNPTSATCADPTYTFTSSAYDCLRAATSITCPYSGTVHTGTQLGWCYLPGTNACPTGMAFTLAGDVNYAYGHCTASPICPQNYGFNPALSLCQGSATCLAGSGLNTQTHKCEIQGTHTCTTGYTYNSSTTKCEAAPVITYSCPTGTSWDGTTCTGAAGCVTTYAINPITHKCESPSACVAGTSFNAANDKCEANGTQTCTGNLIYNPGTTKCEANPVVTYNCPAGTSWNGTVCSSVTTCPASYTLNLTTHQCAISSTCPAYTSLNMVSDKCEGPPQYTCPPGLAINITRQICETNPTITQTCPTGTTYNGTLCTAVAQCHAGLALNTTTDLCAAAPTCPSLTTFNPVTRICEGTGTPQYSCLAGFTYVGGAVQKCEATPTCSTGTYNPASVKCEMMPTGTTCVTGTTYDLISGKCRATQTYECSTGTLDPVKKACYLTATQGQECPPSTTYNSTSAHCETAATIQCPASSTYNNTTSKCETAAGDGITCPSLFTYDSGNDICSKQQGGGCVPNAAAGSIDVDWYGDIYVFLHAEELDGNRSALMKIASDGAVLWESTSSELIHAFQTEYTRVTRDDSGYVYINGSYADNTTNSTQIAALAFEQESGTYHGKKTFAISTANAYVGGAVGNPASGSTFAGTADYSGSLKRTVYGKYTVPTAIVDAAPTFAPVAGTYNAAQTVTMRTSTPGASIIYTTDGSIPSPTHGTTIATGTAITVDHGLTITAIAYLRQVGNAPSTVATATYILKAATPTLNLATGTYNTTKTVTISTTTPSATIVYTTDGSTPSKANGTQITTGTTITIDKTTTLKAITLAPSTGWIDSSIVTATYTLAAAAPTLAPGTGTYGTVQTVTFRTATPGATIAYTTDGSTPSRTNGIQIPTAATLTVNRSQTIKAFAYMVSGGWNDSVVVTATYTMTVANPTVTPVQGTYGTTQTVTISDVTPGATIAYTTDGTTPSHTVGTQVATGAKISINETTTLKIIAFMTSGWNDSAVVTATYTLKVATPTYAPVAGIYTAPQNVKITTTTPGAVLVYTTDGSTPTRTNGTIVPASTVTIPITSITTLKTMAYMANLGWTDSAIASGTYTMNTAQPTITPGTGTYRTTQTVTLRTATPNAVIAYTTDGTAPSRTNGTQVQTGATLTVDRSETVRAIAFMATPGWNDSAIIAALYTMTVATPTVSPVQGNYTTPQTVTLTDTTPGAIIAYTTDGTTPSRTNGIQAATSTKVIIDKTTTLKVIAFMLSGWNDSTMTTALYTMNVATPTLTPATGTFTTPQTVTIKTTTPGATVAYTTDGSTPSPTNGTQAIGITTVGINQITTLKAIAFMAAGGWNNSTTVTGTYTFNTVAPTITPGTATYSTPQTVTIKTTTAGALIRYTTDGSAPSSTNGTVISGGTGTITVDRSMTVRAIAYMTTNWNPSAVMTATFTMTPAMPTVTPAGGNYTTPQTVTIKTTTAVASISYTTDGTTPTKTNGTVVASGSTISISQNTQLKAIAFVPTGWNDSTVLTANYTLTAVAPTFTPGTATYTANTVVTIRSTTTSAVINYTTDGSTPTKTNGTQIANGATVTITGTTTLKAVAYMATQNWNTSAVTTAVYTLRPIAPAFSPVAGTYTANQNVTMTSTTTGAQIIYTTDGSAPTTTNGTTVPSGSTVAITKTTTLKAISHMPSGTWTDSGVATAVYTMRTGIPVFAPAAGTYSTPQTVAITATGPIATRIRYTTDGTTPTATVGIDIANGSTIALNATQTVRAISYMPDGTWASSAVAIAVYTMRVATPTLSQPAGTYTGGSLTVTPSDTTPGIDYFAYLTGAITPTCTTGTQLPPGNSVTLTTGVTTLRVIACRSGWTASAAVAATYTVNP